MRSQKYLGRIFLDYGHLDISLPHLIEWGGPEDEPLCRIGAWEIRILVLLVGRAINHVMSIKDQQIDTVVDYWSPDYQLGVLTVIDPF